MPIFSKELCRKAFNSIYNRVSDDRPRYALPPYESVQSDAVSLEELHGNSNSVDLSHDRNVENRKSHIFSTTEALDVHGKIKEWPQKPRKLRTTTFWSVFFNIFQVLLTLTPATFIVLAALGAKLDGQPVDDNDLGRNVKRIMQLGPSIYPIMFAAVAGKAFKTFARYLAERGMKLGVLETLLASQTVWGTFESQVLLRRFTVVGIHLFLFWCLSPLGGQASLRLLTTAIAAQSRAGGSILYMPTGGMSANMSPGIFAQADAATGLAATNSLYTSSLLSPDSIKLSAQDTWGNIRIPRLTTIEDVKASDDGWAPVPNITSAGDYTSLVGVPISGILMEDANRQSFQIEHGYMELDCPSAMNISKYDGWWQKQLGLVWSSDNGTATFYNDETEETTSFFMDSNTPQTDSRIEGLYQNTSDITTPRNVLFVSEYETSTGFALGMRNCTVALVYLEAKAICIEDGCSVTAIRPSVKYALRDPNLTPLDLNPTLQNFMRKLPFATGTLHVGDASPTELYLRGADMPFSISSSGVTAMLNVSNEDFTTRFQTILNTYYQLSLAPYTYAGGLPATSDSIWHNHSAPISNGGNGGLPFNPFEANTTITTTYEVYRCNYLWFAFLLASSVTVLMLGSVGTALGHLCHAPDMFGFVTSFTYNNPYVDIPPGGSALGAMERARLLKDVRFKLGDAKAQEDVGHVAFGTLHRSDTVGDLNPSKHYN